MNNNTVSKIVIICQLLYVSYYIDIVYVYTG